MSVSKYILATIGAVTHLLFAFGWPVDLKAQDFPVGHGVYRPFNLYRQFKLGTAYFVDPSLPEKAEVFDAYRLTDVAGENASAIPNEVLTDLKSGTLWLGVQVPDEHSFVLTIPCRPVVEGDGSSVEWQCVDSEGSQNAIQVPTQLLSLDLSDLEHLYVLSPRREHLWSFQQPSSLPEGGTPVITWEPQEHVNLNSSNPSPSREGRRSSIEFSSSLGIGRSDGPVSPMLFKWKKVSDERLVSPEPHNWLQIRGNYKGWMNSPLDQINTGNVANLQPAWLFSTGVMDGHQAPPVVNDGVMLVTTPSNQTIALDAATGTEIWRYRREKPEDLVEIHPTNRGPGLYGDQVFVATTDCFLVALDAKSGEMNWEVAVDDYQKGYYMTLAPLTAQGKVLVGVSGGEFGIRGYVAAYNADDGTQAWRTYTIPAPGEPGHETWTADSWQTGGGSAWVTGIFDAETGIVYWGVGSGAPWAGDRRGSLDNLYTTSVIALNLESGAIVGHHQYHWNDSWDWDEVSPPILTDLTYGGRTFKALVNVARNGHIFVLEPSPEGPIGFVDAWNYVYSDVVTAIDPETGRFSYDDAHWPKTNVSAPFCPSLWGGKDWPYVSYSPGTGLLYIPANENLCSTMAGDESQYVAGELWLGVDIPDLVEGFYLREGWEHVGEIQAWDVGNKNEVWKHTFKHHNWGPILSTGGGLLFAGGTNDRMFRAYDAANGSVLWEYPTNSGIGAPPSTYSLDGKQYVAVVSGWGVDAERKQDILRQEIPGYAEHMPQSGVVWTFRLP